MRIPSAVTRRTFHTNEHQISEVSEIAQSASNKKGIKNGLG